MKFSDTTIQILKNFSGFNPGILLRKGNTISTVTPLNTVMATAIVDDEFPQEAGIADLQKFLAVLNLFKEPDIEFGENAFIISDGTQRVVWRYGAKAVIAYRESTEAKMPDDCEINVDVTWQDLQATIKAAGVLGMKQISVSGDGNKIYLSTMHEKDKNADKYSVVISDENVPSESFDMIFKTEKLKMLPMDYNIVISSRGIAKFEAETIKYYITTEEDSKFGG